jgi:hypothetical protein
MSPAKGLGKSLAQVVKDKPVYAKEYCQNCRKDRDRSDTAYHSAPCGRCGSDGHASCQH